MYNRVGRGRAFFPLRPTVIEVQLNYIDWRDGSIGSQLIFKLPHSLFLSLLSSLSQMGHFHKVFIPELKCTTVSSSATAIMTAQWLINYASEHFLSRWSVCTSKDTAALSSDRKAFRFRMRRSHVKACLILKAWFSLEWGDVIVHIELRLALASL